MQDTLHPGIWAVLAFWQAFKWILKKVTWLKKIPDINLGKLMLRSMLDDPSSAEEDVKFALFFYI